MLTKNTNFTDKYKVNSRTAVTVKNTETEDEDGNLHYKVEVTLKHKLTADQPLAFADDAALAEFIGNVDLEDPQTSLGV